MLARAAAQRVPGATGGHVADTESRPDQSRCSGTGGIHQTVGGAP